MDYLLTIITSLIFIVSLVLLNTRKRQLKKQRNIVLLFLIFILISLLCVMTYDIFIQSKNRNNLTKKSNRNKIEQFGAGNKRNKLMDICGLPKNYRETSHCFNDSTHHTCCMLGPKAIKYADDSGNPIGTAAKKAFKHHKNRNAKSKDLTPWCTCFGSEVCSFYANKFKDGTHIKLINNPNSGTEIVNKPSKNCEGFFRDNFNVNSHGTPGVEAVGNVKSSCKNELSKIKNVFDLK
jgi:hypothetical protein